MNPTNKPPATNLLNLLLHIQWSDGHSLTSLTPISSQFDYHAVQVKWLTILDPVAIVDSSNLKDMSDLTGVLDIFPSVGESIMHQALPVPDWTERSTVRMDRAAIISSEF
jgi:hypothetical protein